MKKLLTTILFMLSITSHAAIVTVDAYGEAEINGNLAAAKIIAENRAKWNAIEKATDVQVSVSSVIYNQGLMDEAIKYSISGSVSKYTVIDEGKDGNTYWVSAKIAVDTKKATNTVDKLSLNSSVAVIIPMVLPDNTVEFYHPFAEQVAEELAAQGFDPIDVGFEYPELAKQITAAVSANDMNKVAELANKLMVGTLVVGNLKIVDKGKNVGYTKINFAIVDGELSYRVIGNNKGKKGLILSSSIKGRGQGSVVSAAAYNASSSMAKKNSAQMAGLVAKKVFDLNKNTIRVVLSGNNNIKHLQNFKEDVTLISWVLSIKERGVDTLIVEYGEKTYYLASMLSSKGYKIKSFTDTEIIVMPY